MTPEEEAKVREWVTSGPGRHPWREGTAAWMLRRTLAALDEARRERDAYKRAKAENDERFMRERDEARERCREAAQVLIEAVGADGPCDVGDAARRAVEALGAARPNAIEECAKVCEAFEARWREQSSDDLAEFLAARLRALLEPGQCEAQKPAAVGDVYEVPGVPVYWTITKADDRYVSAESEDGSYIGRRMPWTPPPDWRLVRTGPR